MFEGERTSNSAKDLDSNMFGLQQTHGDLLSGQARVRQPGPLMGVRAEPSRVYKLMEILHDKQDQSFVEKVVLSESDIFSLCNALAANSAKSDGQRIIDFAKVDVVSKKIVGFYGSKEVMREIFHDHGIGREEVIWSQMMSDELTPGLYLWLREDCAFIFYWHHGNSLPDASQRGMSCNFVRYIVDLCDTVCVCLQDEILKDGLLGSFQKFSKKQRTERLQISLVKATVNSISVSPGYSLTLKTLQSVQESKAKEFKWTEGSSRLALLASFARPPKVKTKKVSQRWKVEDFPATVISWKKKYSLDLSKLSEEDFITFLVVGKVDGHERYKMLSSTHTVNSKMTMWNRDVVRKVEEKVLRTFLRLCIDICLEMEDLAEYITSSCDHADATNTMSGAERTTAIVSGSTEEKFPTGDHMLHEKPTSTNSKPGFDALRPEVQKMDGYRKKLQDMEGRINGAIFGKASKSRLIFPGAEVQVQNVEGLGQIVFKLEYDESAGTSNESLFKPFLYGNDVILKANPHQKSAKDMKGSLGHNLEKCFRGIVADVGSIRVELSNSRNVHLKVISRCSNGLEKWIRSEVRDSGEDHAKNVEANIWIIVEKYCKNFFAARIETELQKELSSFEAGARKEQAKCLLETKEDLSQRSGNLLVLCVESCKLARKDGRLISQAKELCHLSPFLLTSERKEEEEVNVSCTQQELESESVTWKAFEFAPLQADMDTIVDNPKHVLNPSCSEEKDLIDVDPAKQKLLRVFFLKGGQALVLIEDITARELHLYVTQTFGAKLSGANPVRTIKRGYELICFDERSRFIAFYDSSTASIKVYRFDNTFCLMDWTGMDIRLGEYSIGRLNWMDFVSGKNQIAIIDDHNRLCVCEIAQPAMVRPVSILLGSSLIIKALISPQGSCLLVMRLVPKTALDDETDSDVICTREHTGSGSGEIQAPQDSLIMDIYKLDDTIVLVDSVNLQVEEEPTNVEFSVVSFGSQMHLSIHSREAPGVVTSKVLTIVSASDVCKLQQINRRDEKLHTDVTENSSTLPGPILDYIPQVFDKFATSPALAGDDTRELHILLLLQSSAELSEVLREKCLTYVESSMERLRKEKGKNFQALKIRTSYHDGSRAKFLDRIHLETSTMGCWIRRLICLAPIQIARAENNALSPMVDGFQLPISAEFVDAISLANMIRFGLYETVINQWVGSIKVISSMGKQSCGNSYLLNHLTGSLLDVAGGRCTDGVWMTVRQCEDCLYVLLDFEGLGSEQEDMLLSVFSAAFSNVTILNKDFHLRMEIAAIFERFQNGVNLLKADPKLFRGLFYIAIKNVDLADVEDLKREFSSKISHICSKSQDNFLTKMYGGAVEISAMPFFNRPEFYESIRDIGLIVEKIEASYRSGKSFLTDAKIIIAQITTKDWSSIDSKRVDSRIRVLRGHLNDAISMGCFFNDRPHPLIVFDDLTPIVDGPLEYAGVEFTVSDFQLELLPVKDHRDMDDVLCYLIGPFKEKFPRNEIDDEMWHMSFSEFVNALVGRRKQRVLEWLTLNTADFSNDGDAQKLRLEANALLSEVQHKILLCSCKCEKCFLRCVQVKGHSCAHSCRGNHRCSATCTYCEEETYGTFHTCGDVAGHDGSHACKENNHTCLERCFFAASSSNCNGGCCRNLGHDGDHRCNSKQHKCTMLCSLPSCQNQCVQSVEGHEENDIHACHEKLCREKCSIGDCNRTCATKDHFHSEKPDVLHSCGSTHPCPEVCEHEGNCEVQTEVKRRTTIVAGKRTRGTFDYELVSEQNGKRKGCCISIPPFKKTHDGRHCHSRDPSVTHFCESKCRLCGYFCTREVGHRGLHRTSHGSCEESEIAELCNIHCKTQGRGHIHLISCPTNDGGVCRMTFDGVKHESRKYGPDLNTPKDEMTHSAYWEYVRFEDPCSHDERKEFELCNYRCKSDEHDPPGGAAPSAQHASFCTEYLWHESVAKGDARFANGYISDDGHHFGCDHSQNMSANIIFLVDRSSSMSSDDCRPSLAKFGNNRLGCVYEAITRFIRTRLLSIQDDVVSVVLFNSSAQAIVELEVLSESIVNKLLCHNADGSKTYSSGLVEAERILQRSAKHPIVSSRCPFIIFLSDGGNNAGDDHDPLWEIRVMKSLDSRLKFHTIMFGNNPAHKLLKDMASAGDGTFEASLDKIQLNRRFESLARSMNTKVA